MYLYKCISKLHKKTLMSCTELRSRLIQIKFAYDTRVSSRDSFKFILRVRVFFLSSLTFDPDARKQFQC